MYNIIGHKNIFLTASAVLVGLALLAIALFGFRQGIDFTGGTLWQIKVPSLAASELHEFFKVKLNIPEAITAFDAQNSSFLVRLPSITEEDHQKYLSELRAAYPGLTELGFQSIGPSVGRELRGKAFIALALVLIGISLYIAFAFRKISRPVASWKYGVITLLTLFHDVLIPAGFLSILGRFSGVEVDTNFMVALLVVMGFSVHDTIVVFDRIRENLSLDRGKTPFAAVINASVNQTLGRSVNTSLTLILVLVALLFVGPSALFYFVLTLLIGVSTGIYSSIFVASPALLLVNRGKRT